MASTAEEMVQWYQQALAGEFFKKPQTLFEFRRIQAMADALGPPDSAAQYSGPMARGEASIFKGSTRDAGQMIVASGPITFCTTINWTGPDDSVGAAFQSFVAAVTDVLQEAVRAAG